jgi:hypothetical protein
MLYPDWAAEMADWLLRLETVQWVVCTGTFRNALYLAIRTRSLEGGAGKLAQAIVGRRGVVVERVRQRALQRLNVPEETIGQRLVEDPPL